jgi:hypothetical protein
VYQKTQNFILSTKQFKKLLKSFPRISYTQKTKPIYEQKPKSALLADYFAHNFFHMRFWVLLLADLKSAYNSAFLIQIWCFFKNIFLGLINSEAVVQNTEKYFFINKS